MKIVQSLSSSFIMTYMYIARPNLVNILTNGRSSRFMYAYIVITAPKAGFAQRKRLLEI